MTAGHPQWCRSKRTGHENHVGPITTLRSPKQRQRLDLFAYAPAERPDRARIDLVLIDEALDLADEHREAVMVLTPKMANRLCRLLMRQLAMLGIDPQGPPASAFGFDPEAVDLLRRLAERLTDNR